MNQPIKILIGSVIVILLGIGLWLGIASSKQQAAQNLNVSAVMNSSNANASGNINVVDDNANTNASAEIPEEWSLYQNDEYGFSLAFPPEWGGYSILVSKNREFTDYNF